jgi:hypothetical protein
VLPTYSEDSLNGLSALKYVLRVDMRGWLVSAGASANLMTSATIPLLSPTASYRHSAPIPRGPTQSPSGAISPPARTGALSSRPMRSLGYALEAPGRIARGDLRHYRQLCTGSARFSLVYRLNSRQTLHGSINVSSQLPPIMDMISYAGNRSLHARLKFGRSRWGCASGRLTGALWTLNSYWKSYRREAVSTEYPALMLSNLVDTLGQGFVWLPLVSSGTAQTRGVELAALRAHWHSRVEGIGVVHQFADHLPRPGSHSPPRQLRHTDDSELAGRTRVLRRALRRLL